MPGRRGSTRAAGEDPEIRMVGGRVQRHRSRARGTPVVDPVQQLLEAAGGLDVRRLTRMMDKDANGRVSKSEFMQYMSQTFDRLDVNKSGQLEPNELGHLPAAQRCAESGSC